MKNSAKRNSACLTLKKHQYKNWTVPSKASYIGLWTGLVGIIIGLTGIGLAVFFYVDPPKSPPTDSDEFIRHTNPTNINLVNVKFQSWLGDPEKSLTLYYKNITNLSANDFSAEVEYKGVKLKSFKSNAFKNINMSHISIPPGKVLEPPVVKFSEIQEKTKETICGIGLKPIDLNNSSPKLCAGASTIQSSMLKVTTRYMTIFKEQKEAISKIWLYRCNGCESANKMYHWSISTLPPKYNSTTN